MRVDPQTRPWALDMRTNPAWLRPRHKIALRFTDAQPPRLLFRAANWEIMWMMVEPECERML